MQSLEKSARTVEEAVEAALAELGASRDEVDVEVLSEGRGGILGLGVEEARVRVTLREGAPEYYPPPSEEEVVEVAQEILENLLRLLGVQATVEVKSSSSYGIVDRRVPYALNIGGEELGVLIGRRGETLSALQYLVNLILSKRYKSRMKVFVDVDGYRLRRQESLRGLAMRMASQVVATGRPVTLEAMPPYERRIVHLALQGHPQVITESIGEGEHRKVIISAKPQT
jgi:spoIIIJ-associated protein